MPSEREIDNYIDNMEKENAIYVDKELEYADNCHKLEEELGCSLDIRCNIYTGVKVFDKERKRYNVTYTYKDGFMTDENRYFYWKDYKKTWWLREDQSE